MRSDRFRLISGREGDAVLGMRIPDRFVIQNASYTLDGGSTFLQGVDGDGMRVAIHLDWSLDAQEKNATELRFNGRIVGKRSDDERRVLEVLAAATFAPDDLGRRPAGDPLSLSPNHLIGTPDIGRVLDGIADGPAGACRAMAMELIANVRSDVHVKGCVLRNVGDVAAENAAASVAPFGRGDFEAVLDLLDGYTPFLPPDAVERLEAARRYLAAKREADGH